MFEALFYSADALTRHRDGPFAEDRERFLEQRSQEGFSLVKQRAFARMLLWIAGEERSSPALSSEVSLTVLALEMSPRRLTGCSGAKKDSLNKMPAPTPRGGLN